VVSGRRRQGKTYLLEAGAVRVNAIVGGTPAYRREFIRNDTPRGPEDFDAWVTRTVLNPETPLFHEGRYLLAEEPDMRDTALYHSVLAAVADGKTTRDAQQHPAPPRTLRNNLSHRTTPA